MTSAEPPEDAAARGTGPTPVEWAAITEATAALRRAVASVIAAAGPDDDAVRMIGQDPVEARAALPSIEPLATRSVWSLASVPADPQALEDGATAQSRERGLDLRIIVDVKALSLPVAAVTPAHATERVHLAPVMAQLILIDERLAVVSGPVLRPEVGPSCWLVSHPTVVEAARSLWHTTWDRSVPLPSKTVILTDRQREVAKQLLLGETDTTIARRLGVSVRTVASEVRFLGDSVGATSRYQIAMRLFQR